jgi:hypothetical protein
MLPVWSKMMGVKERTVAAVLDFACWFGVVAVVFALVMRYVRRRAF